MSKEVEFCKKADETLIESWIPKYICDSVNKLNELNELIISAAYAGANSITVEREKYDNLFTSGSILVKKGYSYLYNSEASISKNVDMMDIYWSDESKCQKSRR